MRILILVLLIISAAFAQAGNETSEGGNISSVNTTGDQDTIWHGVCGQTSSAAPVPLTINATPEDINCLTVNTGASQCEFGVEGTIHLLFSASPPPFNTPLSPGNLNTLDIFIAREAENATATFTGTSEFIIPGFGGISGVPSVYTNSPSPNTFRMGYLQDQSGTFVFVTPVVEDQPGFNGSLFDFQLMLPTQNGTPTLYHVTPAIACKPKPEPPQGGGGTGTPFHNVTRPPEPAPPPPPPPPGYECGSDLNCDDGEYCDILPGQSGGSCKEVMGRCGYAQNHTWVVYECGPEAGCLLCPPTYSCVDHACVLYELVVPVSGMMGENVTVIARENGAPCISCDIEITDPEGSKFYGKTGPDGRFTFPLTMEGVYGIALIKNGQQLKSAVLTSTRPAAAEKPAEQPMPPEVALCVALLVLLLILMAAYILSKKPKGVKPK